jgi:SAM-dependent methyltransferase
VVVGTCPICERRSLFYREGPWLRDQFLCLRCGSIPRWRALISVIQEIHPDWRGLTIHESSPSGAASRKLARDCQGYVGTHYFPDTPVGTVVQGYRCEDLQAQTFGDESFDLVVTSDVFEHLPAPAEAFREIARTLRTGGAHVFTVPWYYWKPTLVRAVREGNGIRHLEPPDYHANPIDPQGSLVFREWGWDLCDFIYEHSGMTTTAIRIQDRSRGIEGKFIEVFVSRKPGLGSALYEA